VNKKVATMVVISKKDEDKVAAHIFSVEAELARLRALLQDVALKSENEGHLDSGDMIVVTGRDHPGAGTRCVVKRVVYQITKLEVVLLDDFGEAKKANEITDLDVSQIAFRRATDDDDSQGAGTSDDNEFPDSVYGFQSD